MAYSSWSVVFGEIPSAAKWNILGTNDAHFYSFLGDNSVWQSWTPTLSGRLNNAKWTKVCKYIQIGKTVHFSLSLTASTTTPMDGGSADAIFTLPVTAVALGGVNPEPMGAVRLLDAATAVYAGVVLKVDTTTARIRFFDSAVAAAAFESVITSTAPFTWTTSDEITCQGTYQAA